MKTIGISYGVLAPEIADQLDGQGLKYDPKKMKTFEKQRDAINTLSFGFILSDSAIDKAFTKLNKNVIKHVAKENNMKVNSPKETDHRKI